MKLGQLVKEKYSKVAFIGFYEEDEKGNVKKIYPDYMDEILETHSDREVEEIGYSKPHDTLVVKLIG